MWSLASSAPEVPSLSEIKCSSFISLCKAIVCFGSGHLCHTYPWQENQKPIPMQFLFNNVVFFRQPLLHQLSLFFLPFNVLMLPLQPLQLHQTLLSFRPFTVILASTTNIFVIPALHHFLHRLENNNVIPSKFCDCDWKEGFKNSLLHHDGKINHDGFVCVKSSRKTAS